MLQAVITGISKKDRALVYFYLLFIISLLAAAYARGLFVVHGPVNAVTPERLQKFLAFYRENFFSEISVIFINNSAAALILIYFTPLAILLKRRLVFLRSAGEDLTKWDRLLLYGFPVFFLIKQGIVIGLKLSGFADQIGESLLTTFIGIIFPHLSLEALALCLAAVLGLHVTRRCLAGDALGYGLKAATLAVVALVAAAALLEVSVTPKVFAFFMIG